MLEIQNVSLINNVEIVAKKRKKTQILLFDTKRRYVDYATKIGNRITDNHKDLPHFIVKKSGEIVQVVDDRQVIDTFGDDNIDNKIIKIALENLGWLERDSITGIYYNWIGDPYRIEPHTKSWRTHRHWDKYTDRQEFAIRELCVMICEKHGIPLKIVDSHTFNENAATLTGIVCKSNYDIYFTDINPSFNFNLIKS